MNVWNFIDYHLLEHVVSKFGGESLQHSLKQYVLDLEEFESQTTVQALIECWPTGRDFKPSKYEDATIKVDRDPKSCTVKELSEIRKGLCMKFLPPLSNLIMLHSKHSCGCFVVTWSLLSELATELKEAVRKDPSAHSFFTEHQILSLTVGGRNVYTSGESLTQGTCNNNTLSYGDYKTSDPFRKRKLIYN